MQAKPYREIRVDPSPPNPVRRRYSVTSDVVSFRRCARQYGAFRVHNFAPAHQTQIYYGTIVHQVLDRCHQHYHGDVDRATKGTLPDSGVPMPRPELDAWFEADRAARREGENPPDSPSQIVSYFLEAEAGLRSRGIHPVSADLRAKAAAVLQNFNALEGPELYPRVFDTEHRLQADQDTHVLHGVVDLLVDATSGSDAPEAREIWDYKGQSPERLTQRDRENYAFQMRVYARLYELKHGVLPGRVLLYFVNELEHVSIPGPRPANALMEVTLGREEVDAAVAAFRETVGEIETARKLDQWEPAEVGEIGEQDCAICDLRWDCQTPNNGQGVKMRIP